MRKEGKEKKERMHSIFTIHLQIVNSIPLLPTFYILEDVTHLVWYTRLVMATERVTRNRIGPDLLKTVPEPEPFTTDSEPTRTVEP